jgi:hypothetical protein
MEPIMSLPNPPLTGGFQCGGCQCGGCRYLIAGAALRLYACHCTECRAQSASAFGISLIVRVSDFALTSGTPKVWERPTASGGRLACNFCPDCGSRLFHHGSNEPENLSVKGGSLDQAPDLSEAYHIWTASKLPGVIIPPGATSFPGEPPD